MTTNAHPDFITVYQPVAGWKAMHMMYDEDEGIYEPWTTSHFAYDTREEAVAEATRWADDEGIELRL